ncbi:serine/threonine-protein kinase [Kitasatospora kifunensis]|uniref:Outer membrane protein assembly factor BamB n=1 Tax=Kitasatospora kifunensis TaxID=58351 RepID=A0A7W7R1S0_KITKI|nr:serine/threonine-protein kinase [Kitasatospora kifunensis]MBB4923841.1 outer membrane protein assembly factor BamB [Kitasatospora kifunensis]
MGPQPLGPQDPQVIGPYELLARLGSGGMGRVYLARPSGGEGPAVAVKVVDADYARGRDYRPRFRAEVTAAGAVSSPYVAALVAADAEAEPPWLAVEFVRGVALRELVEQCGALPETAARRLGAGLAEALAAIHTAGLAHRDLTPANVLLTSDGPRVIDFGIARAAGAPQLTRTGAVIGTPGYLAPEAAAGFRAGPAGDLYALGAVLYYAATGHGPHLGPPHRSRPGTFGGRLHRLSGHGGPDLRAVPAGLRPVLRDLLSRDPLDRPLARAVRRRLLPEEPGAQEALDYLPTWLPAAMRTVLASQLRAAEGYLQPPERARSGLGRAFSQFGGALTGAARAADPARPAPPVLPAPTPAPTPATLSRRGLLLTGAAVTVAAGALGWAALSRPARPSLPSPPPQLPWLWVHSTDITADKEPQFATSTEDGMLLYSSDDQLIAVRGTSGVTAWSFRLPDTQFSDPVVTGPLTLALAGDTVYCFNTADGSQNWTQGQLSTSLGPVVPQTLIMANDYAVYGGGPVQPAAGPPTRYAWFALSLGNHSVKWVIDEEIIATSMIFASDSAYRGQTQTGALVFASDRSGYVVVRDPLHGVELWHFPATSAADPATSPVKRTSWIVPDIDQFYLPIGQDELTLQALAAVDGSELWQAPLPLGAAGPWAPPAPYRGLVLTTCGPSLLYAYDASNGTQRWSCALPGPPAAAPSLVVNDSLFVPGVSGHLYRVDLRRRRVDGVFAPDSRFGIGWRLSTDKALLYARLGRSFYALAVPS